MPRSDWKVLNFQRKTQTPRYLNASHLPASAQAKLSEVIHRYDQLMKERPAVAVQILLWAERMLQIFDA